MLRVGEGRKVNSSIDGGEQNGLLKKLCKQRTPRFSAPVVDDESAGRGGLLLGLLGAPDQLRETARVRRHRAVRVPRQQLERELFSIFRRKADGESEPFDLGESLRQVANLARTQFRTLDITLTTDIPDGLATVMGERVIFEQVLLNLFSNARDAIEMQGSATGEIVVSAEFDTPDGHIVHVRDTGGGVPDEIMEKLFDPFFTTKEPGKGTGLGLSISFGTIRDMAGEISVKNVEHGACFSIKLPAWQEPTSMAV